MIQVTFQFKTIEEAVATLGTLLQRGAPVPNVDKPAVEPAAKGNRKPRADAGKARGPYKNVEAPSAPPLGEGAVPGGVPGGAAASAPAASAAASTPETAPPEASAQQAVTAAQPLTPEAGAAPNTPDEKAVQAALDKMFTAKGLKPTMALLNEFGVAKGRDLKPEQRADFIAKAEEAAK